MSIALIQVGTRTAIVDAADAERLSAFRWWSGGGQWTYPTRWSPEEKKRVLMHREIVAAPPHMMVDHINGDAFDNRRENLRVCTNAQNQWNRRLGRSNTTGFKGVSVEHGGYRAQIRFHQKRLHLGTFGKLEDAARAYDEAAARLFGEFARLNFPATPHHGALQ